jgi:hypothetical protein
MRSPCLLSFIGSFILDCERSIYPQMYIHAPNRTEQMHWRFARFTMRFPDHILCNVISWLSQFLLSFQVNLITKLPHFD